jgi:transposase, IS5 family
MLQPGFFDIQYRMEDLNKAGDPLVVLKDKVDWSKFKPLLDGAINRHHKSNAGRKPYPSLLMFKIMVLQSLYNLSDEQMEFQIKDRISFMRFLGLNLEDKVPDQKTIWLYRELFVEAKIYRRLFNRFNRMLSAMGLRASQGTLIDASIIEVPKQRNTKEENKEIKEGSMPEGWIENKNMLRQKDMDAKWQKKNGKNSFGYKMHTGVDKKHKLIRSVEVTSANVHDSQVFEELLVDNTSKDVWADSAYSHKADNLPEGYRSHIHSRSYRNKTLSPFQENLNHAKSKIRCRVEHVYGFVKGKMGLFIRTIGLRRADFKIVMSSLAYNMWRGIRLAA